MEPRGSLILRRRAVLQFCFTGLVFLLLHRKVLMTEELKLDIIYINFT